MALPRARESPDPLPGPPNTYARVIKHKSFVSRVLTEFYTTRVVWQSRNDARGHILISPGSKGNEMYFRQAISLRTREYLKQQGQLERTQVGVMQPATDLELN